MKPAAEAERRRDPVAAKRKPRRVLQRTLADLRREKADLHREVAELRDLYPIGVRFQALQDEFLVPGIVPDSMEEASAGQQAGLYLNRWDLFLQRVSAHQIVCALVEAEGADGSAGFVVATWRQIETQVSLRLRQISSRLEVLAQKIYRRLRQTCSYRQRQSTFLTEIRWHLNHGCHPPAVDLVPQLFSPGRAA